MDPPHGRNPAPRPILGQREDVPSGRSRVGRAADSRPSTRFLEQAVELVADRGQLQPREHPRRVVAVGAAHQPPPATASYSASGRSRSGPGGGAVAVPGAGPRTTAGPKPATPSKWAGSR